MVYHVHFTYRQDEQLACEAFRYLLVFPNRQCADEVYNWFIGASSRWPPGQIGPMRVIRHTPQVWSFLEFLSPRNDPLDPVSGAQEVFQNFAATEITSDDSASVAALSSDPTGYTEYLSGKCYYIRTKAKPHLYWFREIDVIALSATQRHKFRISDITHRGMAHANPDHVLEGSDEIFLSTTDRESSKPIQWLGSLLGTTGASERARFRFGAFYDGSFRRDLTLGSRVSDSLVVYDKDRNGDVWELVS